MRIRALSGVSLGLVIVAACGGGDGGMSVAPPSVASVVVSLARTALTVGEATQATAEVRDANGRVLGDRTVAWSTSDPSIATVTSAGLVTSIAVGTVTITATIEGKSGSAALVIAPTPVASVVATLASGSLIVGQTTQATAVVRVTGGATVTDRAVVWSTSDAAVATVSSSGLVTAVGPGQTSITATSEGKSGTATLTVAPPVAAVVVSLGYASVMPGQTTEASASVRDAAGNALQGRSIAWSSSDTAVATVASNGVVMALASGAATISAVSEGKTGSIQLAVQTMPPAVTTPVIEFSPPVYSATAGKGLAIILDAPTGTTSATLRQRDGRTIQFRRLQGSTRFVVSLAHDQVVPTCLPAPAGILPWCGYATIDIAGSSGTTTTETIVVPQDVSTSLAPIVSLAADVQRTDYVVNIRDDGLRQADNTRRVVQKFYQYFGDVYEYIALSELGTSLGSIFFSGVRNRVTGVGLTAYDNSALYGASSTGRLLGFINFRNYFDLAHQVTTHEMGHAFINFLRGTALSTGIPHWPLSTTAFAIMGGNGNPGSNSGFMKPVLLADGTYRLDAQSPFGGFNNLELYLMGLADSSEVENQVVFQNQSQTAQVGSILQGPTTVVTIRDIVSANGLRTPRWAGAPVTFRLASVVVSRGRLLTPMEMANFDLRARRGEATTRFSDQFEAPFYVNTKGRGILVTKIPSERSRDPRRSRRRGLPDRDRHRQPL
jgi:uncharacterized protein YjdB